MLDKIKTNIKELYVIIGLVVTLVVVLALLLSSCVPAATAVPSSNSERVTYSAMPSTGSIQCVSDASYLLTRCIDSELGKVIYVRGTNLVVSDIK